MPRIKAQNRILALGRAPVTSQRRKVGFLDDNKIHVVLDTNVLIYGLQAAMQGHNADSGELLAWKY